MKTLFKYENSFGWKKLTIFGIMLYLGTHPVNQEKTIGIKIKNFCRQKTFKKEEIDIF